MEENKEESRFGETVQHTKMLERAEAKKGSGETQEVVKWR